MPHRPSTGIAIQTGIDGTVSEYEQRETARWAGYTFTQWARLSMWEQARTVAHRRMNFLIELHVDEASRREQRMRDASARARKGRLPAPG